MSEEKKEPGFKFVDKRRFDESGESRHIEEEKAPEQPKMVEEPAPKAPVDEEEQAYGPITFSLFIQSLAQQSVMSMGLIPWPDSGEIRANLDHARETIDVLSILHEKTKGNLTASEQKFFDSILYELRVTFVEVLKGHGAK